MQDPILRRYDNAVLAAGPMLPAIMDRIPFGTATIGVWSPGGSVYSLEFTLDYLDIDQGQSNIPNPDVRWFTLDDMPIGTTGNQYSVCYYPFQALRLNIPTFVAPVELKILLSSTGRW